MKTLRSISTAVLLCLVFAAPATAAPTLELIPSTEAVATGGTGEVTYTLLGSAGSKESYALFISAQPQTEVKCPRVGGSEPTWIAVGGDPVGSSPFKETFTLPHARYENKGRYTLCAMRDVNGGKCEINNSTDEQCASSYAVLTVTESRVEAVAKEEATAKKANEEKQAAEKKAQEEREAKEIGPVPVPVSIPSSPLISSGITESSPSAIASVSVTIVNPPAVNPIVKPVSKLGKALKQCKKLKKHSKRVACEKQARKLLEKKR